MNLFKYTLTIQSIYFLLAGIWPLIHIDSFMYVTGSKADIWLVKTVGALLIPISMCFITAIFTRSGLWPVSVLAGGSSAALLLIDFYYAGTGIISKIYMADGLIEIVFVTIWIYIMTRHHEKDDSAISKTYMK